MIIEFEDVLAANRRYAERFELGGLEPMAARNLAVLTCIDSRIAPLAMLGLQPGDAKIVRNAGARLTGDALRSLMLASHLLAVRRIMIVAHTDCALGGVTDDELRTRLAAAQPGVDFNGIDLQAAPHQEQTLRHDVAAARTSPHLPDDVVIAGFVYDVETGLLSPIDS